MHLSKFYCSFYNLYLYSVKLYITEILPFIQAGLEVDEVWRKDVNCSLSELAMDEFKFLFGRIRSSDAFAGDLSTLKHGQWLSPTI